MIIATATFPICADVRANGDAIRALMDQAAAANARLIHFGEGALSGYAKSEIRSWDEVDWAAVDTQLASVAAHAARLRIWIAVGCAHRLEPPLLPKNSLFIISDHGEIAARYDKRFLSHSEVTDWYTPGTEPVTFEIDGIRFGCALCIEVVFPKLFAEYERLDVDCLLFSTYACNAQFEVMARAHAMTNCYWVSMAVSAENEGDLPGMIIGPDGFEIARCPSSCSALASAEIDKTAPRYEIALQRARPWRRRAANLEIYPHRLP